jgi:hypothetical protein
MKTLKLFLALVLPALIAWVSPGYTQTTAADPAMTTDSAKVVKKILEILQQRISEEQLQLLESITIVTPDQSVPSEMARFSGAWSGEWRGERTGTMMGSYILVVEKITPPTASVIYAGISSVGNVSVRRRSAEFVDGTLVFTSVGGATTFTNRVNADGTIAGILSRGTGRNLSILTRIK